MVAADLLRDALRRAQVSVPELARRAGVGRSSLYRYLEGGQDPGLTTVQEILAAVGLTVRTEVGPVSDPAAGAALRALVEGRAAPAGVPDDVAAWTGRLERVGSQDPAGALRLGGSVASALRRPDAVGLSRPGWDVDRLVSAGRASGAPWALSGWAALDALGHDVPAPTVFWTTVPRRVVQLLADSFTRVPAEEADVVVCGADADALDGATSVDGVRLVAPARAYVDALGLGGQAQEVALAVLAEGAR